MISPPERGDIRQVSENPIQLGFLVCNVMKNIENLGVVVGISELPPVWKRQQLTPISGGASLQLK